MAKTLADAVLKGFSKARLQKALIKVPRLRVGKEKVIKQKKEDKIPVSSIINILIKTAVESAKREKREKPVVGESKSYRALKESIAVSNGGYGTVSRSYRTAPHTSYIDYGKLFSYLGKFRAQNAFETFASESHTERTNRLMEQDNKFYLVDREVIDTGVRSIKYLTHGTLAGAPSAVPNGNISSGEWEKFKLWMIVDYVMFNLKMRTL